MTYSLDYFAEKRVDNPVKQLYNVYLIKALVSTWFAKRGRKTAAVLCFVKLNARNEMRNIGHETGGTVGMSDNFVRYGAGNKMLWPCSLTW